MNVINKFWNGFDGYVFGVPHYYCDDCEKTVRGDDEHCPACGSNLTVVEFIPEYGFGPMS